MRGRLVQEINTALRFLNTQERREGDPIYHLMRANDARGIGLRYALIGRNFDARMWIDEAVHNLLAEERLAGRTSHVGADLVQSLRIMSLARERSDLLRFLQLIRTHDIRARFPNGLDRDHALAVRAILEGEVTDQLEPFLENDKLHWKRTAGYLRGTAKAWNDLHGGDATGMLAATRVMLNDFLERTDEHPIPVAEEVILVLRTARDRNLIYNYDEFILPKYRPWLPRVLFD